MKIKKSKLSENKKLKNKIILIILVFILITTFAIILLTNNNKTHNAKTNENEKNNINEIENANQLANELFSNYYAKAENLMKSMTLEEKVGQMFLARYPNSGVIEEIKEQNPGGYILFSRDFKDKTKESVLNELNHNQEVSKIKLIFGVDEEGGPVVRVSSHTAFRDAKFQSPQDLWAKGQLSAILEDSKEKSELLKSIGLNMNLAPVADVPTKSSSYMYKRSYGKNAQETAIYVSELIKTMNMSNIISAMKHFPGYGDNIDTHTGVAIDERPYTTFEDSDFLPFKSGIESGAPCILMSHNIVKSIDEQSPASLSKKAHEILRNDLNFSGIIITDDLAMNAVKSYVENGEAAMQAILAGNDMIISSDFISQKQEIIKAVEDNIVSEDIIDEAVKRILACKCTYGIIK